MSDEFPSPDSPEWFDREAERLRAKAALERFAAVVEQGNRDLPPVHVGPNDVILLGFDDEVDAIVPIPPAQRSDVWLQPLHRPRRSLLAEGDPMDVSFPVATYRRAGEFTYRRES